MIFGVHFIIEIFANTLNTLKDDRIYLCNLNIWKVETPKNIHVEIPFKVRYILWITSLLTDILFHYICILTPILIQIGFLFLLAEEYFEFQQSEFDFLTNIVIANGPFRARKATRTVPQEITKGKHKKTKRGGERRNLSLMIWFAFVVNSCIFFLFWLNKFIDTKWYRSLTVWYREVTNNVKNIYILFFHISIHTNFLCI